MLEADAVEDDSPVHPSTGDAFSFKDDDVELGEINDKPVAASEISHNISNWPVIRAMKLNAPEWYLILIGIAGAAINGGAFPIFSIVRAFFTTLTYFQSF